jgi:hypothetical protein
MTGDFEPEQKRYLEGFVSGMQIAKSEGPLVRCGCKRAGCGRGDRPRCAAHRRGIA